MEPRDLGIGRASLFMWYIDNEMFGLSIATYQNFWVMPRFLDNICRQGFASRNIFFPMCSAFQRLAGISY